MEARESPIGRDFDRATGAEVHGNYAALNSFEVRGEYVFNLRGANTKCQRAKGTMGGGVRITAHYCHTRQNQTEFRAHYVHNTLLLVTDRKQFYVVLLTVFCQRL